VENGFEFHSIYVVTIHLGANFSILYFFVNKWHKCHSGFLCHDYILCEDT